METFYRIVHVVGHGIAGERDATTINSRCRPLPPRHVSMRADSDDESITCSETFHSAMHDSIARNGICPCGQKVSFVESNGRSYARRGHCHWYSELAHARDYSGLCTVQAVMRPLRSPFVEERPLQRPSPSEFDRLDDHV